MSLDDTETLSDLAPEGHEVDPLAEGDRGEFSRTPANYGGFLQSRVATDGDGNVTASLEAEPLPSPVKDKTDEATVDPYWHEESIRRSAVEFYREIMPFVPEETRPLNIEAALADIDKIRGWIKGQQTA